MARNQTSYRCDRQKHVHISRANLKLNSAPVAPLLALKHYFVKTSNQIFWRHLRLLHIFSGVYKDLHTPQP